MSDSATEVRRRAGWHEAGHALMATLHDRVVIDVTMGIHDLPQTRLDPTKIEGILNATGPLSHLDQEYCVEEFEIALAGCAAEHVEFGSGHSNRAAYRFDAPQIRALRRALRERAGRNVRSRDLLPGVISALSQRGDALFKLAREILAVGHMGTLRGATVRSIVNSSPPVAP